MVKKLFALIVMFFPMAAFAGFDVVDDAPKVEAKPAVAAQQDRKDAKAPAELQLVAVSYIGTPDSDIPVVSGFVKDVKLLDAIKQIVPAGWQVFVKDDFVAKSNQTASWHGGRRWVDVLDILANEQGISVTVDWAKKSLLVGDRKFTPGSIQSNKEVQTSKTWKLTEGKTIGREIMAWGVDAGWKVVWNLDKDWSVPANTSFTGDFKSAATAVIKTLAANGVLIRAQFYDGNKTMVVYGPGVAEQ